MRRHVGLYLALIGFVTFGAMMSFGQSAWLPALFGRRFGLAPDKVGPMLGPLCAGVRPAGPELQRLGHHPRRAPRRRYPRVRGHRGAGHGAWAGRAALAPGLGLSLASAAVGLFFVGASFPIGAATLSQVAPTEVMGKVTGVYLLFQTLVGQALGPMLIALGAEKAFGGKAGLPPAFAIAMLVFMVATALSALMLRRGMQRRGLAAVTAAIQA